MVLSALGIIRGSLSWYIRIIFKGLETDKLKPTIRYLGTQRCTPEVGRRLPYQMGANLG